MPKRKHVHNLTILALTGNGNLVVSFLNQNKSRMLLRGSCLLQHLTLWACPGHEKTNCFFILNRIKANHLDITYILSVLQLYVVIVGEVKVEGLDCLSFLCGVCVCVCACTVLITCCVSLAACKLNCFLYINGPRILEAEGQSRYQV